MNAQRVAFAGRDNRGMTLTELMVVITLVGIVAAAAGLFAKNWRTDHSYMQFVRGFDTAVRTARARAVALQKPVVLKCAASDTVKGFGMQKGAWKPSATNRSYYELPFNWTRGAYNVDVSEIWFDGRGFAVLSNKTTKTSYTIKLSSPVSNLANIELTVTPVGHVRYRH
jgi:prepilin-type N-terminal cleavage/methylation domain-containing protein